MNHLLKSYLLDLDPNSPTAAKEWKHWFRTFDNFIIECGTEPAPDKFRTIINLISHNIFDYVEDCTDYDSVVVTLEGLYIKSPNDILARHLLATRRQQPGESLDELLQSLIMNHLLKSYLLDLDPNSPTAAKEWKHWFRTFDNFIIECGTEPAPDKFRTIINLISHNIFDYVEDCTDYDSVVVTLEGLYIKSPNDILARHLLATRRQQPGESLDEFLQSLRKLSKDCNLKAVSTEQYRE